MMPRRLWQRLIVSIVLSGCATAPTLTPISGTDLVPLTKGEVYTAPVQGWFVSDLTLREIFQAEVEARTR